MKVIYLELELKSQIFPLKLQKHKLNRSFETLSNLYTRGLNIQRRRQTRKIKGTRAFQYKFFKNLFEHKKLFESKLITPRQLRLTDTQEFLDLDPQPFYFPFFKAFTLVLYYYIYFMILVNTYFVYYKSEVMSERAPYGTVKKIQ